MNRIPARHVEATSLSRLVPRFTDLSPAVLLLLPRRNGPTPESIRHGETESLPYEVGYYHTPGCATVVAVSGNYAYVVNWESVLRMVRIA